MTLENDDHGLLKGMSDLKNSLGSFITSESIHSDNTFYQKSLSAAEIPATQSDGTAITAATASTTTDINLANVTASEEEYAEEAKIIDPYISLQPAKKKLSSLESQRVMNVFVDMVEKSVLVSMFPFILGNLHLFEDVFDARLKTYLRIHTDIQAMYTEVRRDFLTFCRRMRRPAYNSNKDLNAIDEQERNMSRLSLRNTETDERDLDDASSIIVTSEDDDLDGPYRQLTSDDVDDTEMYVCYDDMFEASARKAKKNKSIEDEEDIHGDEDEYVPQSDSSSESVVTFDSSMEMRESSDESMRARELGKQLSAIAKNLSNSCKNILRAINANPSAAKEIVKHKDKMSPELQEFVNKLNELKGILRIRLLTTPLEEKDQEEYLKETAEKAVQNKKLIEKLEKELAEVTADKDEQVKLKTLKIRKLQNDIHQIDKSAVENIRRVKAEADNTIATEMKGSESKTQAVYQELVLAKETLNNLTTAHREQEQDLRRRKFKAETEVENWIQKYDQDMGQLQEEFETIERIYSEEKKQLMELEERFSSLEKEYVKIRKEREDSKKWKEESERRLIRMMRAATTIQAYWRSYKVRKLLKVRKKKVAAASGRKKKKKK